MSNSKVRGGFPRRSARLFIVGLLSILPMLLLGGGFTQSASASLSSGEGASQSATEREYVYVLRVYFRDQAERDLLAAEFSAEEVPTTGGYLTILTDQATYDDLRARGLRVEVDDKETKILNDPVLTETFYGGYKTVEEIYGFLDQKVASFPTLAEKQDIGDSWCKAHPGSCVRPEPNNGYDLFVMRITNRNIPGPKPVFWFDAGVHSREIATPEVAMRFIDYLLNNYNNNADAHWLVDHHEIWIMPTFNPDGHHIVEAGGNSPYMYRKNGNNTLGGSCAWPPTSSNHHGVDNNRNFPFMWGCCGGSTTQPCAQTYRGPAANSEDETAAVVAKIRTLIPDQRGPNNTDPAPLLATGLYQNMHTVVPVNLIPWGWTTASSPNHTDLTNIAAHMSASNANGTGYSGNGYPYGTISQQLYIVDGGSIDWAYGELGAAAVSTELSGGSFLPAYSCIDNPGCGSSQGLWPENRGMLLYQSKIARTPYLTTRGPDTNNVATNPMTVTQGTVSQLTGTINYAWAGNVYSQTVAAAEYYIDNPPWAGGTGIPMSATDGNFNSPTEGVQATIDTTNIPVGRHIIFVRGRGVNSYEGNQSWGPISAAWLEVTPSQGTPTVGPSNTVAPTSTVAPSNTVATTNTVAPTSTVIRTSTVMPSTTGTMMPSMTSTRMATGTAMATRTQVPCNGRVTVCHRTGNGNSHTISISCSALNAHLNHGDSVGPCGSAPPPRNNPFRDVSGGDYFYEHVLDLRDAGAIGGYNDGTFRPYNQATRAQLVKIVVLAFDIPLYTGSEQPFTDVPRDHPFYQYIMTARRDNIITGYADGTFRPYANVTRGQIAKIAVESARMADLSSDGPSFSDVPTNHTFFRYIETAYANGILSGYADGKFRPDADATRGQITKIVNLATHTGTGPTP